MYVLLAIEPSLWPHDDQSCDFDLIQVLSGFVSLYEGHSPGQGKRLLSHAGSKHNLCFYKTEVGVLAWWIKGNCICIPRIHVNLGSSIKKPQLTWDTMGGGDGRIPKFSQATYPGLCCSKQETLLQMSFQQTPQVVFWATHLHGTYVPICNSFTYTHINMTYVHTSSGT